MKLKDIQKLIGSAASLMPTFGRAFTCSIEDGRIVNNYGVYLTPVVIHRRYLGGTRKVDGWEVSVGGRVQWRADEEDSFVDDTKLETDNPFQAVKCFLEHVFAAKLNEWMELEIEERMDKSEPTALEIEAYMAKIKAEGHN